MSPQPVEQWRTIAGHEDYEVSDQGRVRSWKRARTSGNGSPALLKFSISPKGYQAVRLAGHETCYVHRLVLAAFDGPACGRQARHLDGDPANNALTNLVWGTQSENEQDKKIHGRHASNATHCKRGHSLTDEANIYRWDGDGRRRCRTCIKSRQQVAA